jgi:hypothetical protein
MDRLCPNSPLRLLSWRRDRRSTRLGFAAVELQTASGLLEVREIVISQSHRTRFIAMPAGAYIAGGEARYQNILRWHDISAFRDAVIGLVERADPEAFPLPADVNED